jgi:alkylation response protein AidB-like acyl-CoA dehydrogenase
MQWSPSPEEQTLVDIITRLARERFAPRAALYDRENRFPEENYAELRAHGLMDLTVPKEYGGKGVSPLAYSLAMRELAKGDGSTALTFNMHATIMTIINRLGSDEQKARYFGEVVKRGAIFASLGSEPNTSPSAPVFFIETTLNKGPNGYRINGHKHFCSFGNAADYFFAFTMMEQTTHPRDGLLAVIAPKGTPGVTVIETWNAMGMRATASHSVLFEGAEIHENAIIGAPGAAFTSGIGSEYVLGYSAIYTGIAEAAYEFARDYARARIVKPDTKPIGHNPIIQRYIAEMSATLEASRQLSLHAARTSSVGSPERILAANQAKYFAVESAMKVTDLALRVCGGRGLFKDYPLERYYRDVRAGVVMNPSSDTLLLMIGRAELALHAAS